MLGLLRSGRGLLLGGSSLFRWGLGGGEWKSEQRPKNDGHTTGNSTLRDGTAEFMVSVFRSVSKAFQKKTTKNCTKLITNYITGKTTPTKGWVHRFGVF